MEYMKGLLGLFRDGKTTEGPQPLDVAKTDSMRGRGMGMGAGQELEDI